MARDAGGAASEPDGLDQPYANAPSDAETEPLPFDETHSDAEQDGERDHFSEGSDLTEAGDSDHDEADEEHSSLSEDEGEAHAATESALDGLASLASSTDGRLLNTVPAPIPATSSTLSSHSGSDEEGPPHEHDPDATLQALAEPRTGADQSDRQTLLAAAVKRRAAATGGAASLLIEPDLESSVPPSAATSRAPSPASVVEDGEETKDSASAVDAAADAAVDAAVEHEAEQEAEVLAAEDALDEARDEAIADAPSDTEAPALDTLEHDDDEAMQRRQEALELLTRVEIEYAMVRDRLYNERMEELEAESSMIHDGTHPELQLLHTIIDARKDRRLALLQIWLDHEEHERERWARVEEDTAWVNWRDDAAQERRTLIDDTNRKRRRLDREKRLLDTPPPPRRHQPFGAELVRKPPAYSLRSQREVDRFDYATHRAHQSDIHSFVAYPDLRGMDDYEIWSDMDHMGIRPRPPAHPGYARPDKAMQDAYDPYPAPPPGEAYGPYAMGPGYMGPGAYHPPGPMLEYDPRGYDGYAEPLARGYTPYPPRPVHA